MPSSAYQGVVVGRLELVEQVGDGAGDVLLSLVPLLLGGPLEVEPVLVLPHYRC